MAKMGQKWCQVNYFSWMSWEVNPYHLPIFQKYGNYSPGPMLVPISRVEIIMTLIKQNHRALFYV
jgi:hypothetical protein